MPITLSEGKNNAQTDLDVAVIDEFRKTGVIADSLIFDDAVNPAGGGATLTYGYRRLATQPTAATRAINSEYSPANVTTQHYTTELAVLGGSFEIDRVVAKIGPAASGGIALNMAQKIKATNAAFDDLVINGNTDDDANGFDGLNKALYGSDTEYNVNDVIDWSTFSSGSEHLALDAIDEFLSLLDGSPTVIAANANVLARVRAAARRAGMYTKNPIEGLLGQNGRPIEREQYGNIVFADAGAKAGSNNLIIPFATRGNAWTVTPPGSGNYKITVDGYTTEDIAFGANDAAIKTAVELLPNVTEVTVSSKKITFDRLVSVSVDNGSVAVDGGKTGNVTDMFAYRVALDGFHGVSTVGGQLAQSWLPDFSTAGAVKKGEVELGPVSVALKATKAAAVFRNIKTK